MQDDGPSDKPYNEKHPGCDDALLDELLVANRNQVARTRSVTFRYDLPLFDQYVFWYGPSR